MNGTIAELDLKRKDMAVSILLGYLSWHLVESKPLKLKALKF
jgi:hypothetical protein